MTKAESNNASQNRIRAERRKLGLCKYCGIGAAGRLVCLKCGQKHKVYVQRCKARMLAANPDLCPMCVKREKFKGFSICTVCSTRGKQYARKISLCNPWVPGGRGRPPIDPTT
jgi:hypothetical protein